VNVTISFHSSFSVSLDLFLRNVQTSNYRDLSGIKNTASKNTYWTYSTQQTLDCYQPEQIHYAQHMEIRKKPHTTF